MEKSLLQVVPIDPMVIDVYRPKNVCHVGNYNMHTHLLLWLFILQSARQYSLEARGFARMANVRWSDGSIGSIGQAISRSDKYFTDGEMTSLQSAISSTVLRKEGFKNGKCRWSDGSIGSIGQGILRSDKYFTDGELTNPVKDKGN